MCSKIVRQMTGLALVGFVAMSGCGGASVEEPSTLEGELTPAPSPSPSCVTHQYGYCFVTVCTTNYGGGTSGTTTSCWDVYGPLQCTSAKCASAFPGRTTTP
jgi:hypothetical protein